MTVKTIFYTSSGAQTVPSDFRALVSIEAIGAGAAGTTTAGGGGGAYAGVKSNGSFSLTAGGTFYVQAGSGVDSWFNATSNTAPTTTSQGILAKAASGTAGGSATSSIGLYRFGGGGGSNSIGYGGGGAAGPGGAGGSANNNYGGGGGATLTAGGYSSNVYVGGNGGDNTGGGAQNTSGTAGTGGGGGGGDSTHNGGNGATGSYWTQTSDSATAGSGGGGGAATNASYTGGNGGLYGGGGGGGGSAGGTGGQGIVVLTYSTVAQSTYYWVGGSGTWDTTTKTNWASTSGGTGGAGVPNANDNVIFNSSSGASPTITLAGGTCLNITVTAPNGTMTFSGAGNLYVYGSLTLPSSGVSWSPTGSLIFGSPTTGTITTSGTTFAGPVNIWAFGSYSLADNYTCTSSTTLTYGTFNANNLNVNTSTFVSSNSNTRVITMGSGLWALTGTGSVWDITTTTNLTVNKNTANIVLTDSSSTAKNFIGNSNSYNKLTISCGGSVTLTSGTFSELASTRTDEFSLILAGTITTTVWSITGNAAGYVDLKSSVAGTQRTLNITNPTSGIDYLSFTDIAAPTAPVTFYAGVNSYLFSNVSGVSVLASNTARKIIVLKSGTTWTVPSDWTGSNEIHLFGAGGGSSGTVDYNNGFGTVYRRIAGAGGGGGGYTKVINQSLTPGQSVPITVGAGGTAGSGVTSNTNSTGGAGGSTTFGTTTSTIALVNSSKASGSAKSITITTPTSTANGNLLIAFVQNASTSNNQWDTITGWTQVFEGNGFAIYYQLLTTAPAANYTFTTQITGNLDGYLVAYSGAQYDTVGAISSSATPSVAPAITVSAANSVVLDFIGSPSGSITFGTPTGFSAVNSDSDATTPSSAIFAKSVNAGSTGTVSSTPSSGSARSILVSINPAINPTYSAGGGGGGVANASAVTSIGGVGGTGTTYNGGAGGNGGAASSAISVGGGGGGGGGGPLGKGGAGGAGASANIYGGGGGGNGGGSDGTAASGSSSGAGGNNKAGVGGGTSSAVAFNGGGGAGGNSSLNKFGSSGVDIVNAGMGGAGGAGANETYASNGLGVKGSVFGGGASGAVQTSSTNQPMDGAVGGAGAIIIVYDVSTSQNFFMLFE